MNSAPCFSVPSYDVDFRPVIRFGVMSDVHVSFRSDRQANLLTQAIRTLYLFAQAHPTYQALDAILFCGDCADRAKHVEYQAFTRILKDEVRQGTEVVACMGNHEFLVGNALCGESGSSPERWEHYMGLKPNYSTVIKGVHFIAVSDYTMNADTHAFVKQSLQEAGGSGKPIFFLHHAPFADTVTTARNAVMAKDNSNAVKALLSQYPQVFDFSGHSHYPLNDARNIVQTAFTSVGAGTLQATLFNDTYTPADPTPQMMIVEIDAANRVRIFPYDLAENAIINGHPWVIEDPFDPTSFTYTAAAGENAPAPCFANGDILEMTRILPHHADLSIPVIDTEDTVVKYLIRVYGEDGQLKRSVSANAPVHKRTKPSHLTVTLSKLKPQTAYRAEVSALNTYGKASQSLSVCFCTPAYEGTAKAKIASASFDGQGSPVSQNGLKPVAFREGDLFTGQRGGVFCYGPDHTYSFCVNGDPKQMDLNGDVYKLTIRYWDNNKHYLVLQFPRDSSGARDTVYFITEGSQTWRTHEFLLDDVNLSLEEEGELFSFWANTFDPQDVCISHLTLEAVPASSR